MYRSLIYVTLLAVGLLDTSPRYVFGSPANKDSKNESPKCGLSKLPTGGVANKIDASEGDFPWHAVIYHKKSDKWESACGGTLVTPRIVLTGAICVTNLRYGERSQLKAAQEIKVALGKLQSSWDTKEKNQVTRSVKEVRVHPNFIGAATNYAYDLALLILDSDVPTSDLIMPACLDLMSVYSKRFSESKDLKGYITGFGSLEECSSYGNICERRDHLKYVQTTVMDYNTCADAILAKQPKKITSSLRLSHDHFCVGNGTVSPVQQGDSGGGLTSIFDGLHYVFGTISLRMKMEIGDKLVYSYGGITSVPFNIDWLKSQLG